MPGLFDRIKVWTGLETVKQPDLNAEFDNIISNLIPSKIDDYSANLAQFQETLSPGDVGTEVLPTKLSEEIKTLRYMIGQLHGGAEWYSPPESSISGLNTLINSVAYFPSHRVQSGRKDANNQPMFLVPNGAAKTVTLKAGGSNPDFVAYIASTQRTFSADISLTGLTAAPSSNNTCLVNDALLVGAQVTKTLGENGTTIPIDNVGTEISALNTRYCAFKIVHSAVTEYFVAEVDTSAGVLKNVMRGFMFDSSDAAVPRVAVSDNDVITLLKISWIFATYNSATPGLDVTYNVPVVSKDEPQSPASGDYWFDITNATWKKYNGSSYITVAAIPIGVCAQDATNTVCARSADFFAGFSDLNTLVLERTGNNTVRTKRNRGKISVYGQFLSFEQSHISWDMGSDLDSGETDSASTTYYFYVTDYGDKVISSVAPHDRRPDLLGFYHPSKPWRCVGECTNDGSANFGTQVRRSDGARIDEIFDREQSAAAGIGGLAVSSLVDFNGASTILADVTNATLKLRCTGNKPVRVTLQPEAHATDVGYLAAPSSGSQLPFTVALLRDGTVIGSIYLPSSTETFAAGAKCFPANSVDFIDRSATAGEHTYKLQYKSMGSGTVYFVKCNLVAYEMIG